MTSEPDALYCFDFDPADRSRFADFDCGGDPWSRQVSEWIRGPDATDSRRRGTRIWGFENESAEVVGFGSLGTSRWRWPLPDGPHLSVLLIPMLGVASRFQGLPADPQSRFAVRILSHLIAEARQRIAEIGATGREPPPEWLLLLVHQDNLRAIRFYERCGFLRIPDVVRRNNHCVMKLWLGEAP